MLRGLPLRLRLTAAVVLLVSGALAGSGVVASRALHDYLVGRLDTQLVDAQIPREACTNSDGGHHGEPTGPDGVPSRFYVAQYSSTGARRCTQTAAGSAAAPQLPTLTATWVKSVGGHPFTAASTQGEADWRVLVGTYPDGDFSVVAASLSDVDHTLGRLTALEAGLGVGLVVVLGLVGYLLVRQSLRPLVAVEQTAVAIAGGELSRRVANRHPRTEVGRLTAVLNDMLDRIQDSFEVQRRLQAAAQDAEHQARASEARMRRFVGDASHELRTPLTSIRGFAELYRQGAVEGPAEVDRVMARVESEAARMGGLVDDLLLLARLDQERPLVLTPVDLLTVAADVVHDARAGAPDHPIDLEVSVAPPVVLGDEARLRQVLHNLVANAHRHTPAGTAILVRLAVVGADALVEVVDHGPGLPAAAREQIFERFYRTDTARDRDRGGAGLGLAIVAALVHAHSGTVDVVDTPGGGATFRVRIPHAATPSEN